MAIDPSEIRLTLSGGINNDDPDLSLGGDPSPIAIESAINNLFDDVTGAESEVGAVDHRCFYVFNDNEDLAFRNVLVFTKSQVASGSFVDVGIPLTDHVQTITFAGSFSPTITTGTFVLSHEGDDTDPITWSDDANQLAIDVRSALLASTSILSLTVNVITDGLTIKVLELTFDGDESNKFQSTIVVAGNLLDPLTTIGIVSTVEGQPKNAISPQIVNENDVPPGITFLNPVTQESGIEVGDLLPLENFFVWLRRTTAPSTQPLPEDNIILVIKGESLP